MKFLERSVENKKIIWFQESNRYSLLELPAYEVIKRLGRGAGADVTARWLSGFYHLPETESKRFVGEIAQLLGEQSGLKDPYPGAVQGNLPDPAQVHFSTVRYYQLNDCVYSVEYEDDRIEHLIHPKFAYLEIQPGTVAGHVFQVFRYRQEFVLRVNGITIGQWPSEESHYFIGRFSMELLNRMHGKAESSWMGVFHASAISRGSRSVLFLGDSGSGKSTVTAILMSNGFDLLADDFVPVDAGTREVCHFPAAVSVKKSALDHLIPLYPQLQSAAEYYYSGLDKTVRYLAPNRQFGQPGSGYPCKALIFVKYKRNSGVILEKMPKDIAFQHLVPDSWISPLPGNAACFLDWFLDMPCYRLTYSDNEKMVEAVKDVTRDT